MIGLNTNTDTTAETLTFYEADNIPYITGLTTLFNSGMYIKLSNKEYIFADYSRVVKTELITTPLNYGYKNNNEIITLEFSYNEE